MKDFMYLYNATVASVYDGDTVTLYTDLGFGLRHKITVRLYGLNTAEIRGVTKVDGVKAREALLSKITDKEGTFLPIIVQTKKDIKEKFGRYLGIIFVEQDDGTYLNINDWLIDNGFAVPFMTD